MQQNKQIEKINIKITEILEKKYNHEKKQLLIVNDIKWDAAAQQAALEQIHILTELNSVYKEYNKNPEKFMENHGHEIQKSIQKSISKSKKIQWKK